MPTGGPVSPARVSTRNQHAAVLQKRSGVAPPRLSHLGNKRGRAGGHGSKSSMSVDTRLFVIPPVTSTRPSFSKVAVCPVLALSSVPAMAN